MLGAALPAGLIAIANAALVLDHFYARAPSLDAAWTSAIAHRSGLFLREPPSFADHGSSFYGVHVSPFLSVFSLLSYVVPLDRVAWSAVLQAAVFVPLGLAIYPVMSRAAAAPLWRAIPTALVALAFAFSGQALMAMECLHYELAVASLTCVLLAVVVTRRQRWVWPIFILAIGVREDAGCHVALALMPIVYVNWKGRTDPRLHQQLLKLIAVAIGWSIVALLAPRVLVPASAQSWRTPFFGSPFLHSLTSGAFRARVIHLLAHCPYIAVPLGGSVLVAIWRRDLRYLAGWLIAIPWMLLNLLALEERRWRLEDSVGFPFLISLYWVYLYGAMLAPAERRLTRRGMEGVFAAMCIASLAAVWWQYRPLVALAWHGMVRTEAAHPREVRAFAAALGDRRASLGKIAVDPPVAALAIETIERRDAYHPGRIDVDTFAFHRDGPSDANLLLDMSAASVTRCAHALQTGYFLCSRFDRAEDAITGAATDTLPTLLAFAEFDWSARAFAFEKSGVVIAMGAAPGLAIATRPSLDAFRGALRHRVGARDR